MRLNNHQRAIAANHKPQIVGQRFNIKPNYVVRSNIWFSTKESKRTVARSTDANLLDNSQSGEMSSQSEKKIRSAINWLCASAKQKWISETPEHKGFYFKVNFITLTLPALNTHITHENIAKELLQPLLDYARKTWQLKNYVWKIELQANGNPHIHITSDTYINHRRLRDRWNYQLSKIGITQLYTAKYMGCKFETYVKWHPPTELVDIAKSYERWQYGNSIGWSSPNSTDIHAVKNIKDLAAYISKYMAKNITNTIQTKGLSAMAAPTFTSRLWSCSAALSKAFTTAVEVFDNYVESKSASLFNTLIKSKQILGKPDRAGIPHVIADVFFIKPHQWFSVVKGVIQDKFFAVRQEIQNCLLPPTPIFS